jgi:predicted permease
VTPAVLISDGAWRRVFDADPDLPGRTVLLNGAPVIVLGVVSPGFRLELPPFAGIGTDVDVWVPLRVPLSDFARADGRLIDQDSDNTGAVVARLAEGATVERARDELVAVAASLRAEVPGYASAGFGLEAEPLHADATAHARPLLVSLFAGAAGVLIVSCLSLTALLLARGMAGERNRAVRVALGATSWRLLRSVLMERGALLLLGGGASLLVAWAATRALGRILPPALSRFATEPQGVPVVFVLAVTGALATLLTLLSVAHAGLRRPDGGPAARLLQGRFVRGRAREALVVAEVAVSVVLVLGAGLLLRTAAALRDVRPGFDPEGALVFEASVRVAGVYTSPGERARLVRALEDAARDVPGVRSIGLTSALPLSGRRWTQPWGLPGEAVSEWAARRADFRMVTSGYFDAVGTRVLEGRAFDPAEDLDERGRVAVVDAALAARVAPGGSAVGATIGIPLDGAAVEARIVGVVEPVRHDDLALPAQEAIYVPYRQEASRDVSFVVRAQGDPTSLAPAVRRALLDVEPRLAVWGMRPMTAYVDAALAPTRFGFTLLSVYAALALLAAALGLHGVIAWEVGRRTRELGVRMAVGATGARVRTSVLMRGLRLGALGALLGVFVGSLAAGGLRRLVYGVGVADPLTWVGAVGAVVGVTMLASWLPARRASRLDPIAALRAD